MIGIVILCFLQILAIRALAANGGLFISLTYGILALYIIELFYLFISIVGVNRKYKFTNDLLFWGAIIIIGFDILIYFRNQLFLFPISGLGDLLLIVWLLNRRLVEPGISEENIYSIKKINRIIGIGEDKINRGIIGVISIILIIELIIIIGLIIFYYSQYNYTY